MTIALARKKINVVIVGRSASKLEEFSKELCSKYSAQVGFRFAFSPCYAMRLLDSRNNASVISSCQAYIHSTYILEIQSVHAPSQCHSEGLKHT